MAKEIGDLFECDLGTFQIVEDFDSCDMCDARMTYVCDVKIKGFFCGSRKREDKKSVMLKKVNSSVKIHSTISIILIPVPKI